MKAPPFWLQVVNKIFPSLLLWLLILPTQVRSSQQPDRETYVPIKKEQNLRHAVASGLNSLGVFYYQNGKHQKAIETFLEALKYQPASDNVRTNLAMVYYHQGRFEKVIETLDSSVKFSQPDRASLTALAVSYFAIGNYSQAVPYYEKLTKLLPNDSVLQVTLAVAYHLSGNSQERERILRRLPDNGMTRAQYHVVLGDAHRSQMRVLEAVGEYEKALTINKNLPKVNYWLGVLYSELHRYEEAAQAFRRELETNPQSADATYSLGAYYFSYSGDVERAQRYFEKTVQLNPNHTGGYTGLIKISLSQGKAEEALQLAEKAQKAKLESEELHYLKARALNLLGMRDLAEKELKLFEQAKRKKSQ